MTCTERKTARHNLYKDRIEINRKKTDEIARQCNLNVIYSNRHNQ